MTAPASVNHWVRSRNPSPSFVQPPVEARGYHHSTTHRPAKSASDTGVSSWSGRVNDGAVVPGASMAPTLPDESATFGAPRWQHL